LWADIVNDWAHTFLNKKNRCSIHNSRDNQILLSIAAANDWCARKTDIKQVFFMMPLLMWICRLIPPALYRCAVEQVLKLLKTVGFTKLPPILQRL
jgi:hypothetical protein